MAHSLKFGRGLALPVYIPVGEYPAKFQISQMELKKELIGEYTGSFAPSVRGTTLLVRNRTRIYQSEKGHLSYVITEHTTDRQRSLTRRETYVGLVTAEGPPDETGECRLHLSHLDKPYRGGSTLRCDFRFSAEFNSYFLLFDYGEGPERIQFRLKKASQNGSGRRRKRT